jgi:3-hydroxyisobutyrate dehydrogenase-like beta-hydroxyacid dehydrogenase
MMGRAMIDLGDQPPQAATTLKVTGNSFIFNMVEAVAEGDVLAEKTGLGSAALHQYLQLFLPGIYPSYSRRIMTGDYWNRSLAMVLILLSKYAESKEKDYRCDKMSFHPHKSR